MLKLRVITALVLAPLVLLAIFAVPHQVTAAVLAVLVVLGAWEWAAFPGLQSPLARVLYSVGVAAAVAALWYLGTHNPQLDWILLIAALWWLLAMVWISVL